MVKFYQIQCKNEIYVDQLIFKSEYFETTNIDPIELEKVDYCLLKSYRGNFKVTDIIEPFGVSGITISENFLNLINGFIIFDHTLSTLKTVFRNEIYFFYSNLILRNINLHQIYNFRQFEFMDMFEKVTVIHDKDILTSSNGVQNISEYVANLNKRGYMVGLNSITVHKKFKDYEILPFDRDIVLISEKLKLSLAKENLNGIKFTEQKVIYQ